MSKRLCCRKDTGAGCTYLYIRNPMLWRQMCGKLVGYSERTLDGWRWYGLCPSPCAPNYRNPYIDGISVIARDRKYVHLWSSLPHYGPGSEVATHKSEFVGNNHDDQMTSTDYWFCMTIHGDPVYMYSNHFYAIYAVICRDQSRSDEDVLLEHIELYVC